MNVQSMKLFIVVLSICCVFVSACDKKDDATGPDDNDDPISEEYYVSKYLLTRGLYSETFEDALTGGSHVNLPLAFDITYYKKYGPTEGRVYINRVGWLPITLSYEGQLDWTFYVDAPDSLNYRITSWCFFDVLIDDDTLVADFMPFAPNVDYGKRVVFAQKDQFDKK